MVYLKLTCLKNDKNNILMLSFAKIAMESMKIIRGASTALEHLCGSCTESFNCLSYTKCLLGTKCQ